MKRGDELLINAMVMLEEIKRNRELPAFACAQAQYVALGECIRKYLLERGVIQDETR